MFLFLSTLLSIMFMSNPPRDLERNGTHIRDNPHFTDAVSPPPPSLHTAMCLAILGACVTLFTTSLTSKPSSTSTAQGFWVVAVVTFFLATFLSCINLLLSEAISGTRWLTRRRLIMVVLGVMAFTGAASMTVAVIVDNLKGCPGGPSSSVPPPATL